MSDLVEYNVEKIENLIYVIRGKQVMLASDVAQLYHTETKVINQVVKRNINRFPNDFCFQLTKLELELIYSRSQFVTLNKRGSNYKYLPYVFTEHGIMMLSALLKSELAAQVNVLIIKAFVDMRNYIGNNILEQKHINNMVLKHDSEIKNCKIHLINLNQ